MLCTKCKKEKLENEFYNNKTMARGKTYWCKVCSNYQSNIVGKETKAKWAAKTHQNRRKERPAEHLWRQARHRAKEINKEFTIIPEDIIIPNICPYLGTKFSFETRATIPSLDRIDSSKGYTKNNIQVISWMANIMKNNASIEQLIKFAEGVMKLHSKVGPCCAA